MFLDNVFFSLNVTSCVHLYVSADVYVFAVGQQVNKKELTSIASDKKDERHVFVLKDYRQLGRVFNQMISKYQISENL